MEQNTTLTIEPQASPVRASRFAPKARIHSTQPAAEKAQVLVSWLENAKGRHVVALDVTGNPCTDAIIVVTANSARHARSLADGLLQCCTENHFEYLRMEGYQAGEWVLVDLNDIIVHIFQQEWRDLFRIEALWKEALVLHEGPAPAPTAPRV